MYKYIKCTMMLGGQYSLVGLCPVWLYFGLLFVAVAFSSPVPQSCLLPPEIFFAKTTCSLHAVCHATKNHLFLHLNKWSKNEWTLTSSLLVVLWIVTFGLELAGLFGTFPQCTWGFRVVLEFMLWHEAERRQIWTTEDVWCFFFLFFLNEVNYWGWMRMEK